MKIQFSHPWDDTRTDRTWKVGEIGEFTELLGFSLIRAGWATNAGNGSITPGIPTQYVTLADLEAYVPWQAERVGGTRFYLRASTSAPITTASTPARITTGVTVQSVIPSTIMKIELAQPTTGPVTATLTANTSGTVLTVSIATVPAGQLTGLDITEVLIPAGAILNIDITTAPTTPVTGITVTAGAAHIEGVF